MILARHVVVMNAVWQTLDKFGDLEVDAPHMMIESHLDRNQPIKFY